MAGHREDRAHDRDLFSFSETLGSLGSFGEIAVTVAGTNDLARAFRVEEPFWKYATFGATVIGSSSPQRVTDVRCSPTCRQ